jgi:hypothetical protein
MLCLPSSLILSIFLLTAPSLSAPAPAPVADDGMWHPAGQSQASTWAPTTTLAATSLKPSVSGAGIPYSQMTVSASVGETSTKATTKAVAATVATPAAGADWQTAVTWPAGCESWANPCPAGAHISGGATATGAAGSATGTGSYENGFTSYTTMTDSNGVITGMPPKATIAAGVTVKPSNSSVTLKTLTSSGSSGSSSTSSGGFSFSTTTAKPVSANSAASLSGSIVLGAAAVVAALL